MCVSDSKMRPEPREHGADDQHHADVEAVDEISDQRRAERGLEPRERERQRGGGAAQMQLVEDRQEVHRESGVEEPALDRVLDAADRHDPPAVEDTARAPR